MDKILEGFKCKLVEVEEKYLQYIIYWRNNPNNNKYINQPYELTMELQNKWFEKYTNDDTQFLYVFLDENEIPFGTMGLTDIDFAKRIAVEGRLMTDEKYRGSEYLFYALKCFFEHLFEEFDSLYSHSVKENYNVDNLHRKLDYRISEKTVYKEYLDLSKYDMIESVLTKTNFYASSFYKMTEKLMLRYNR